MQYNCYNNTMRTTITYLLLLLSLLLLLLLVVVVVVVVATTMRLIWLGAAETRTPWPAASRRFRLHTRHVAGAIADT